MDTADRVARAYQRAEEDLLRLIARYTSRGADTPGWLQRKLAEVEAVNRLIRRRIRDLDREVTRLVFEGLRADAARAYAAALGEVAALAGGAVLQTMADPRTVELLARECVEALRVSHLQMLRQTQDAYRSVIAGVAEGQAAGVPGWRQGIQTALDQFAARGISGFTDAAGRQWGLREYADMATRTASMRARVNSTLEGYAAAGEDLVRVSDSPEECPRCRPWESRVLSVKGDGKHPSVADATAGGLFHSNCTHQIGLWVEGLSRPRVPQANPAGYEERQQQRGFERRVRRWRRADAVAITPQAQARARAGLGRARDDYSDFIERTGRAEWRERLYLVG